MKFCKYLVLRECMNMAEEVPLIKGCVLRSEFFDEFLSWSLIILLRTGDCWIQGS